MAPLIMTTSDEDVDVPKFRRIDANMNNTDSNVWALTEALEETCWVFLHCHLSCYYIVIAVITV